MRKLLSMLRAFVVRTTAVLFLLVVTVIVAVGVAVATARTVSVFSGFDVPMIDGFAIAVGIFVLFWLPIFELARRIQGRDPPRLLGD